MMIKKIKKLVFVFSFLGFMLFFVVIGADAQQTLNIEMKTTTISMFESPPIRAGHADISVSRITNEDYDRLLYSETRCQDYVSGNQVWGNGIFLFAGGQTSEFRDPEWGASTITTAEPILSFYVKGLAIPVILDELPVSDVYDCNLFKYDFKQCPLGIFFEDAFIFSGSEGVVFRYDILTRCQVPTPLQPVTSTGLSLNCTNTPVTLRGYFPGAFKDCNKTGLQWQWEYQDPVTQAWQLFYTGNEVDTVTFTPSSVFPFPITQNTNVNFRVKVLSPDLQSEYSPVGMVSFTSGAPTVTASDIQTTASCSGNATGSIQLTNIQKSAVDTRYILKRGNKSGDCSEAELLANQCLDSYSYGTFSGTSYTITGVASGDYTLLLANAGGTNGSCLNTYNVHVDATLPLTLLSSSKTDVSCSTESDGRITLATKDGNPAALNFAINPVAGTLTTNQRSATFSNLPAGTYTVSARDACNTLVTQTITIAAPIGLTGSYTVTDALCTNPASGGVTINVSGGSGTYNYIVSKGGQAVYTNNNSATTSVTINTLTGGTYNIDVRDAAHSSCPGYAATFSLSSVSPLTLQVQQQQNVSCNSAANGAIRVSATGGTGNYQYTLTHTQTGQTRTNTDGNFTGLSGGTYTAVVKKAGLTCSDQASVTGIVLTEQPRIIVSVIATDVTCYDRADGTISTTVTGGTGAYTYQWQQLLNTTWSDINKYTPAINSLDAGTYRLKITDANGCAQNSAALSIAEPQALVIDSVVYKDIQCLGGTMPVMVYSRGGNGGNVFEYSSDNTNWQAFTNGTTLFNPGQYSIRMRDTKQCAAQWATPVRFTAPPSALTMTNTLSQYNGYNIACYGATSGSAVITATGGNGNGYSGYLYQLDNGNWQAQNTISGLSAGTHTLGVKDARGCQTQQSVTLTEPASTMQLQLSSRQDILCYGAATGQIQLSAAGGVQPYSYSLNNGTGQTGSQFTGLTAGSYTTKVTDKNGCSLTLPVILTHSNSPIRITASLQQISCYGRGDGKATLQVSGGRTPYTTTWQGAAVTTGSIENLSAGSYAFHVTDNAGCIADSLFTIMQPAVLSAAVSATPVCWGAPTGRVLIQAQGGTPPYTYSADNGTTWQALNAFNKPTGTYTLHTKDAQGCTTTGTATINTQNTKPLMDFLVATSRNALDTLLVKEVCVPAADSVLWTYDPATQVLDDNRRAPKIRFSQTGVYPLTLTGWFGGCSYSLTKQISVNPYDGTAIIINPSTQSIDTITVSPNPNDGNFMVKVKLNKRRKVQIVIISVTGVELYRREWDNVLDVQDAVQLGSASRSGLYLLRVLTEDDTREVKVVVSQ